MIKFLVPLKKNLFSSSLLFFSTKNGQNFEEPPTILRNNPTATEVPKEELKLDPLATSLEEYKKAMESFHSEKYDSSEELFKRTLQILENSKQASSDTTVHILKKYKILHYNKILKNS